MLLLLLACAPDAPPGGAARDTAGPDGDTSAETGDTSGDTAPDTRTDTSGGTGDTSAPDSGPTDTGGGPEDRDGDGVSALDDCDDADPGVFPGAAEACRDGVDNDCDPSTTCPLGASLEAGEADAEVTYLYGRFGALLFAAGDTDGDGVPDISGGDLRFFPVSTRGEHEVASVEVGTIGIGGTCGGPGLTAVAGMGDVDADGFDDLAWGAPCGSVSLIRGPIPIGADYSNADAQVAIHNLSNGSLGDALQSTDDFGGDGLPDLAIGDPGEWTHATDNGAVFFVNRRLYGVIHSWDAELIVRSTTGGDRLGDALASVDLDGDGVAELVAGAPGHSSLAVLRAPLAGALTLADVEEQAGDAGYGHALAAVGDWDGDGLDDLAVAADAAVDVRTGSGTWRLEDAPREDAGLEDTPLADANLSPAHDVDGDGRPDLGVGLDTYGDGGGAWIFAGGATGTVTWADASVAFSPDAAGDGLGAAVLGLGDIDGDGLGDLAVGATPDEAGGSIESRIYIVTTGGE